MKLVKVQTEDPITKQIVQKDALVMSGSFGLSSSLVLQLKRKADQISAAQQIE